MISEPKSHTMQHLILILVLIAVGLWIHSLGWTEPPPRESERGAIGDLQAIGSAQALFRDADKEGDGNLDYGTLSELATSGATGLIDAVLGSGSKNGYLFEATYGALSSEFIWIATARPAFPTGSRYFVRNHEGVTYYTSAGPFELNSRTCAIPTGATRVGR